MAKRLLLFSIVEERWDLATDSRPASWRPSRRYGSSSSSKCRHPRQSVGKDHGKRGIKGYDAGKKVKGRKRHILVDTLGLLLIVVVHSAAIQDRDGAKRVLQPLKHMFWRLRLIWADGGYTGRLLEWTRSLRPRCKLQLEIVKRSDQEKKFRVLPRRWVVERTFAWLGRYRRLSKDYEFHTSTSEAMILFAMTNLMLRRLATRAF